MSDHDDPDPAIRSAREADLPEIHRVDNEVFASSPYSFLVLRQHFDAHGDHLLVRYEGGSLQGYVLSAVRADRSVGWVLSLAVAHGRRGRGLGRQLMEEALRRLDEAGVLEARLAVEPANKPAITLYEALGFSRDGDVQRSYFGPGEDRLIMSLKL